MMRDRVLGPALVVALLGLSVVVGVRGAAAAPDPPASVRNSTSGVIGRFGTAVVDVWQRCVAGAIVGELVVDVEQPGVSGSRAGTFGAVCDAAWHRVRVEMFSDTGDPFAAGPADVSARFTVLDPASMDPLPQGTDTARVTLLPPAEVRVGREAHVGRFGAVVIPVLYRCQRPWLVAQLSVEADQAVVSGTAFRHDALRCDALWHHLDVGVSSSTGDPFRPEYVDVLVRLDVQDPVDFDPVEQAVANAHVWVSPAARIVIVSARLGADRRVTVTLAARCHRPFLATEWGVQVSQRDGRVGGSAFRQTGLTCDALWHTLVLRIASPQRFRAGAAVVDAVLDIQDPVDFDPVAQATDRRTFRLAAPG